jgi:hypothetical protein
MINDARLARHGRMTDDARASSVPEDPVVRPMTRRRGQAHASGTHQSNHWSPLTMYANFAAGTLIVLGALITVLGLFAAAEMLVVIVGLAAVLAGGMLGAVAARQTA